MFDTTKDQARAMAFAEALVEVAPPVIQGAFGLRPNVRLHGGMVFPAATDYVSIYLNEKDLVDQLDSALAADLPAAIAPWWGAVFHEVGHFLISPGPTERPLSDIQSTGPAVSRRPRFFAWNVLEDQRMERILIGRHPGTLRFLQATVLRFLVQNDQVHPAGHHAGICGRTYMPPAIRAKARELAVADQGEQWAADVERVVTQYLDVTHPRDNDLSLRLIDEMAALLDSITAPRLDDHEKIGADEYDTPARHTVDSFRANKEHRPTPAEQRKAQAEADEAIEKAHADDEAKEAEEAAQGAAQGEQGDESTEDGAEHGEGQGEGQGEAQGSAQGDGQEGDEPGEGEGSGSAGPSEGPGELGEADDSGSESTGGTGSGGGDAPSQSLGDLAREHLDRISGDLRMPVSKKTWDRAIERRGLADAEHALAKQQYRSNDWSPNTPYEARGVARGQYTTARRRLAEALSKTAHDAAPGWVKRSQHGRLDVDRIVRNRCSNRLGTDVFEKWHRGRKTNDIEVFILVDSSGSMYQDSPKVSLALDSILHACSEADIPTSVITYASAAKVLKRASDPYRKLQWLSTGGSTEINDAMNWTYQHASRSEAKKKLVINLTDGSWGMRKRTIEQLTTMANRPDFSTILFTLNWLQDPEDSRLHQDRIDITDPKQMAVAVEKRLLEMSRELAED